MGDMKNQDISSLSLLFQLIFLPYMMISIIYFVGPIPYRIEKNKDCFQYRGEYLLAPVIGITCGIGKPVFNWMKSEIK